MTPEMAATVGRWRFLVCEVFVTIGPPSIPVRIVNQCFACSNENLRFLHTLEHRETKQQIQVGVECACILTDSDIPHLAESEAQRKEHWRVHYRKPGRCYVTLADLEARGRV